MLRLLDRQMGLVVSGQHYVSTKVVEPKNSDKNRTKPGTAQTPIKNKKIPLDIRK